MKLRSHKSNKNVIIKPKPVIMYYFLSQQEKKDKIKAFSIIIKNFKNK